MEERKETKCRANSSSKLTNSRRRIKHRGKTPNQKIEQSLRIQFQVEEEDDIVSYSSQERKQT